MQRQGGTREVSWWHHVGTIVFTAICAWCVFRAGHRPPGLTYLDIAVHETGHAVFGWAGEAWMLAMGSGTQILFPLLLGVFFLGVRRDLLTGAVLLAWAGEACGDAAIYIADAPVGALPLLGGGGEGDWTRILGPDHLSRMALADEYARNVRVVGALLMLAAVGLSVWGIVRILLPAPSPSASGRTPGAVALGPLSGGGALPSSGSWTSPASPTPRSSAGP